MKNIKGAIFDLDGTLVDSLVVWEQIWGFVGEKYFQDSSFRPTDEEEKAFRTMPLKDSMEVIHNQYNIASSGEELLMNVNEVLRKFYKNEVKLKTGAKKLLEGLKERDIKMCIASASDMEMILLAIEHTGIAPFFSGVFSCVDIDKGKDEPDIYLLAMEHLGSAVSDTCVFEDSSVAIATAKKIGMKTVGIYEEFNFEQEKMKNMADVYIDKGEALDKFLSE